MPSASLRVPRVSVLIVSFNRADDLRLVLQQLSAGTRAPDEIIVVDNASKDDAADVAEAHGCTVVRNAENVGFAAANNQALALATGDYVALLNNDAVPHHRWLETLVEVAEETPGAAAVGGKMYFWDDHHPVLSERNPSFGDSVVDARTGHVTARVDVPDDRRFVGTLSGCALLVRRAAIDAIGHPFLEPLFFTYYEETDFCARALRAGWSLVYDGRAAVWHRVRASTAAYPYHYFHHMARNRVLFAFRNFDAAPLEAVWRQAMWRFAEDVAQPWKKDDETRARRDAGRWLRDNRAVLEAHRRATWGTGASYQEALQKLAAPTGYFDHPRPEVAALVPAEARNVVDVGCGGGALGASLKRARPGIAVRGVEPTDRAAGRARKLLDDVMVGRAEDEPPASWPRPDCVIFADVLEHLVDPWAALRCWHERLAPGGHLVVSLPNVQHASILDGLVRGEFNYEDAGILDRTHLRFFTAKSARELLEGAGFEIELTERVVSVPRAQKLSTKLVRGLERIGGRPGTAPRGLRLLARTADFGAVQILVRARKR